jgi:D-alanyl-D-alanine-carboxypeptidase/D-alanyl-D-alanine-endopeptidase
VDFFPQKCGKITSFIGIQIACGQLVPDSIMYLIKAAVDNKHSMGIVVGVVNRNGSQVFSYGKVKENSDQQPDGNTLFEIGSITKTFTCSILADMVSKDQLSLNDPISKFLPKSVKTPKKWERNHPS